MKNVCVVLICFFILACTSTKVHLYTRYLSTQESEDITKVLEELGFEIITNTLLFPDDIEQSTLLYSPFIKGEDTVNIILTSLDKSGWAIPNVQPLFSGNHYYTKNSLGLLLLPEGVLQSNKVTNQDLANEYQSEECDISIKLRLKNDGSYRFSFLNKANSQSEQLTGSWQVTSYPYIELISSNKRWRFYYEIQKNSVTDVVGKINTIELKPVDEHYTLPQCRFVYGVRV